MSQLLKRYIKIGFILLLCWILTLLEPYGLRLRHYIMSYYNPIRAKQRAVWLYNHIMRSRLTFLKFARRQLRRNVLGQKGLTKITFKEFLRAKLNCFLCRLCLGSDKQEACLLCGEVFRESDPVKPIRCATPGCPGIYCQSCFNDLRNLCTVCLSPIEYGDMSDISEEKGSDDDDDDDDDTPPRRKPPDHRDIERQNLVEDSGNESDSDNYDYQYEKKPSYYEIEWVRKSDSDFIKSDYVTVETLGSESDIEMSEIRPLFAQREDKAVEVPSKRSVGTSMNDITKYQ